MCRALLVMCVASDRGSLADLKRATVGSEWELTPGATDAETALAQMQEERPHVLVAFGDWGELVEQARERWPVIRIVTDRDLPGADVVATSFAEVRGAVLGRSRPGGPVRS